MAFSGSWEAAVGLFQKLRQAPERVKLGIFAASFFDEAPVDVIDLMHPCLGRPALAKGLANIGAGSGGDIEGKVQVFVKGAKAGNAAYERLLRSIMADAAVEFAGTAPVESVNAVTTVFREVQSRGYVLEDTFDPVESTLRIMYND